MAETGALLGGEFSGHICFRDKWYGYEEPESRYLVEISPEGVSIYKVKLATKMQY